MRRLPLVRRVDPAMADPPIARIAGVLAQRAVARAGAGRSNGGATATAFQRRRDVNLARLNRADRLIAMSHRVAEIYSLLGVEPGRLSTLRLTLPHIERLRPRRAEGRRPVTFATLGGLESDAKGARRLLDAVRSLSGAAPTGSFRLLAFGYCDPDVAREVMQVEGVALRGPYDPEQLNDLLEVVDVGIMPSVWEEAYGYAGVEFLAKGIPVIANAIGGIVEYVTPGRTGWLNRSRSSDELAQIMVDVIENPGHVVELNGNLRAERDSLVKPLARHVDEMDAIYDEALAARSTTA
jgi:glycosyltransferase involved in cell wall biosynthesis